MFYTCDKLLDENGVLWDYSLKWFTALHFYIKKSAKKFFNINKISVSSTVVFINLVLT